MSMFHYSCWIEHGIAVRSSAAPVRNVTYAPNLQKPHSPERGVAVKVQRGAGIVGHHPGKHRSWELNPSLTEALSLA